MGNLTKALFIKGVTGVIFAVIGYIGFFVGGDLADLWVEQCLVYCSGFSSWTF